MTPTPEPLQAVALTRAFRTPATANLLPDPNPRLSPNEVRLLYARQYPALVNASVEGPLEQEGVQIYTFTEQVGKKG